MAKSKKHDLTPAVPEHGETVTVTYPAHQQRRRWCAICGVWTWENGAGVFRHGKGMRNNECRTNRR